MPKGNKMKNGFTPWLKENVWNLGSTIFIIATAWGMLTFRVMALEDKLAQYPSQDYFELKFETLEDKIDDLEAKVDKLEN